MNVDVNPNWSTVFYGAFLIKWSKQLKQIFFFVFYIFMSATDFFGITRCGVLDSKGLSILENFYADDAYHYKAWFSRPVKMALK